MAIFYLFIGLLVLTVIDVPIAIGLGAVAALSILITDGPTALLNVAVGMYNGTTSFPLLAIPLFILAGSIMNACGISRRLIAFASSVFGFVRGGLAMMGIATAFAIRYRWPIEERFRLARVWETFKEASWSSLLPVIILGGIFGGVVTATEGAALAVLA